VRHNSQVNVALFKINDYEKDNLCFPGYIRDNNKCWVPGTCKFKPKRPNDNSVHIKHIYCDGVVRNPDLH